MTAVDEIISTALGVPADVVADDLEYGAIPEWDSLNHVKLMLALESAYGIEIDEDRMIDLISVAAIREFAAGHAEGAPR